MSLFQVQVVEQTFDIQIKENGFFLNNKPIDYSFVPSGKTGEFHLIVNQQSVPCFVHPLADGGLEIYINGQKRTVYVKNEIDLLLEKLDMNNKKEIGKSEIYAQMPGLVVSVAVTVGQTVKKGDRLVVLEAMKMENEIKSPIDGIIQKIMIQKGDAVAKNALLLSF